MLRLFTLLFLFGLSGCTPLTEEYPNLGGMGDCPKLKTSREEHVKKMEALKKEQQDLSETLKKIKQKKQTRS